MERRQKEESRTWSTGCGQKKGRKEEGGKAKSVRKKAVWELQGVKFLLLPLAG